MHFSWGDVASSSTDDTDPQGPGLLVDPILPPAAASVLTVGTGEMFATLAAALAVATNGTTILVDAGTYTDDFGTVTTKVTIAGVGGVANFVADEAPPNDKGILTVDNDVTIENCSFSGCAVPEADGGNGAGIRYEGGQMALENDSFIGNQDGLLAFPAIPGLSNTIDIDHCLFEDNGAGDGYTHNAYIGNVASLTFTNNISEGAIVGHELKSRAYVNDIENNVFMDGPTGTASYEIDLPNGGADTVVGNVIEKGPMAQNQALVHFGGEGIPYAGSSLLVSGNTFQNDYGSGAVAVLNQTAISATISDNQFDGFDPGNIAAGPAIESGNVDGNGNPLPDTTLTGVLPGNTLVFTDSAPHVVTMDGTVGAVEGGAGLLTVEAVVGHVIAVGGSGGLQYSESSQSGGNTLVTASGATDWLSLSGMGMDVVDSEGTDSIVCGAGNVVAALNGVSVVSDGAGNNQYSIAGTTTITGHGGSPVLNIGGSGSAAISGALQYLHVENNGGTFSFNITEGGASEAMSDIGGAVDVQVYNAAMNITTGNGLTGATLTLGAGAANILSTGADTIYAGSGADTVIVEGAANVYAGKGQLSIYGRSDQAGANVYGAAGTYTIGGDTGNIVFHGSAKACTVQALVSNITLIGGGGRMTVLGGAAETFIGGSGGLTYNSVDQAGADTITTAAGAHDVLNLADGDIVSSHGEDTINGGFGNQVIAVTGNSTVNGSSGNSMLSFSGVDVLNGVGSDQCTVSAGATLTVNAGSLTNLTEMGATVKFNQTGSATAGAVINGGGAMVSGGSGCPLQILTAANLTTSVTLAAGTIGLVTQGADVVRAGSGADAICIQGGPTTVTGGAGTLSVLNTDPNSSDTQTIIGGKGAITFSQAAGTLSFIGGAGAAMIDAGAGQVMATGGTGSLTIAGGLAGEQIVAGSGALSAVLTSNGADVEFGSGAAVIQIANSGVADTFDFLAGHGGGNDIITGFRGGYDSLNLQGVTVKSETVSGGSTKLVLSDNTRIVLNGFADTRGMFLHH